MLEKIFSQLGLSEAEASAYLLLLEHGRIPAGELSKRCDVPRTTLYGHLQSLSRVGLITKTQLDGVTYWQSEDPERLLGMVSQKVEELENVERSLIDLLPTLQARKNAEFLTPKFTYLEGVEGVRQILRDILLYRNIDTEAFWPIGEMLGVIGDEFLAEHNAQRIRQGISIRAIWPQNRTVSIDEKPFLGVDPGFLREIRLAPESIDCRMAYWIYGNKVAFTSSRKECFGFIVESPELTEMLRVQFNFIFSGSKPLEVTSDKPKQFLRKHGL